MGCCLLWCRVSNDGSQVLEKYFAGTQQRSIKLSTWLCSTCEGDVPTGLGPADAPSSTLPHGDLPASLRVRLRSLPES
ncbi:unnamed protein product [Rangifer tarandus platyrhynchus]|uniref:Uncharacterized protein n=1 Tax=Rangifer tarandus platyrhynchus TaxID=3082113 RepID=A0AC59YCN9_RANTA